MTCFVSTIITLAVLFIVFFALLLLNKYGNKESMDLFYRIQSATIYCFFMMLSMTIYILISIFCENNNALINAGILVGIIWVTNKVLCWLLDTKYIDLFEKKLFIVIAVLESSFMFLCFAVIEQDIGYFQYIFVDLAIIIGFFVSLDSLLEKNKIGELMKSICQEFGIKRIRKSILIVPSIILGTFIVGAFIMSRMTSEKLQEEIDVGMIAGIIIFIGAIIVILIHRKMRKKFINFFFGKSEECENCESAKEERRIKNILRKSVARCKVALKKVKVTLKLKLHNGKVIIKVRISQAWYWLKKFLGKALLPLITISGLTAIVLSCYFLFCNEQTRSVGEDILKQFQYKTDFIGSLVTSISLCAASLAIIVSIRKPKYCIKFINDHGFELKSKKKNNSLTLGLDENGNLGYQSCIPSDWNMFLYNIGSNVAENIRIKLWIDNVYFDHSLEKKGYDLDNFVYGCGVFERISFDLTNALRQGEKTQIPKIPFHYSCVDADIIKKRGYTTLHIQIYCNNQKSTLFKFRIAVEEYDLGNYDYSRQSEETEINSLLREFIGRNWKSDEGVEINEYNYHCLIEPYSREVKVDVQLCKRFYSYYCTKNLDKMVFWGRIYYRALGEKKETIESILQTEILRLSAIKK